MIVKQKGLKMGYMSELDLSLRELIFKGTLEENLKANVGAKIKIKDSIYIATEKDIRNYYQDIERTRK